MGAYEYGSTPCLLPKTPSLRGPAYGAIGVSLSAKLDWTNALEATSYDVQVCGNSACSVVARSTNVTSSQWIVTPAFTTNSKYYWHVRSLNACGNSPWSNIGYFTTCTSVSGVP